MADELPDELSRDDYVFCPTCKKACAKVYVKERVDFYNAKKIERRCPLGHLIPAPAAPASNA